MTDIVEIPALVLPSPFPTTADRSAGTYNSKSKAWADSEPEFGQSVVAVAKAARTNALAAKEIADDAKLVTGQNKVAAQQAQSAAEKAAAAAADSAAFYGRWSDLTGPLTMPATVSHNGKDWRLQHNLADVALAQPGVSPAWAEPSDYIEVGSIRVATKKPTSGVWLECNAIYLQSSYPSLFAELGLLVLSTGSMMTQCTLPNGEWTSVAYGNGVFVAVSGITAASTVAATSPDGVTWTQRALPISARWTSVTYGNGVFVAVALGTNGGDSTIAATSPDGVTWTQQTLPTGGWTAVGYGNGVFVAFSGRVGTTVAATSPDGVTWTQRTTPLVAIKSVAFGNGLFVAIGSGSTALSSTNGISWTARTMPVGMIWPSVTYGNGIFVAVSEATSEGSTSAATSTNGLTWTQRALPVSARWTSVTYGDGLFVAVALNAGGSGSSIAATSPDGVTWTQRQLFASNKWSAIAFGSGVFSALGSSSPTVGGRATVAQILDTYYGYSHLSQFFVPNALTLGSDKYKQFIKAIQ